MALREFLPDLVNYLDLENIAPFLISKNLLTYKDREDLQSCSKDRNERVVELARILERKGPNSYAIFLEALQNSVGEDNVDMHLGHKELLFKLPSDLVRKQQLEIPGSNSLAEKNITEKLTECVQETAAAPSSVDGTPIHYAHRTRQSTITYTPRDDLTSSRDFFGSQDSGMLSSSFCRSMQQPLNGSTRFEPQLSFAPEHMPLFGFPREETGAKLGSALGPYRQESVEDLMRENHQLKETNECLLREKKEMEYCMRFCMPVIHDQDTVPFSTEDGRVEYTSQGFFHLMIEYADPVEAKRCTTQAILECITGQPLAQPELACTPLCPVKLQNSEHTILLCTSTGELLPIGVSFDLVITVCNEVGSASRVLQSFGSGQHRVVLSLAHGDQPASGGSDYAQVSSTPIICLPLEYRKLPCFEYHLKQFLHSCMENTTKAGKDIIQNWAHHIEA